MRDRIVFAAVMFLMLLCFGFSLSHILNVWSSTAQYDDVINQKYVVTVNDGIEVEELKDAR